MIPSLAPYSIKNGEKLTLSAVVRSQRPVASVVADLGGMAQVTLEPNTRAGLGQMATGESVAVYQGEWTGAGLEEKVYAVTLTITDVDGHSWTDHSLAFSDPAAGNSTVGTTAYPMSRVAGENLQFSEASLYSGVIDAANGYAYFGTGGYPATVVKVALGSGGAPPVRVGAVRLNTGEDDLRCAVIDPVNGYAYFGGITGRIVKIGLGAGSDPPTRVGAVTLDPGEGTLYSAAIDIQNGYAYFGAPDRLVKVALGAGSNPPTRIGAASLNAGEGSIGATVIDTANGYAYVGTRVSRPARVVKFALGAGSAPPSRVGAVTLLTGENDLSSEAIDVANGFAYFGTYTTPGIVVKVALGDGSDPPTRVGALTLQTGESELVSAVIDIGSGYLYFGTDELAAYLVKVAVGSGSNSPTRIGRVSLLPGESYLHSAVIDPANGHAFVGTLTNPAQVVKISLGSGSNPPTRVAAVTLHRVQSFPNSAVVDPATRHAFLGTNTSPGQIVKVSLGNGSSPPENVGSLILDAGLSEIDLTTGVIDPANGYAYFGTDTTRGRVIKVALGGGSDPPTRVGSTTFNTGEDSIGCAVIDAANGYAYFGTRTLPAHVVKVALGSGSNPPTRVGALTLGVEDNGGLRSAVIDTTTGHAYFGNGGGSGRVLKIALGSGANPPTRVGAAPLNAGETGLACAIADIANGYAYFGTTTSPGRVVKVALGNGADPPTRVGAVTLNPGEDILTCAVADTTNGYAYFGTSTSPGRVVKVALGSGSNPPSRLSAITMTASEERFFISAAMDPNERYLYLGTSTAPGKLVKVSLTPVGLLKGTRFTIPEGLVSVTDVRMHSHAAVGNVRMAIYDNAEPKNLLWQSGEVANTAANSTLTVPISSGTPPTLNLAAGTYWATWQIDSDALVPSYTQGTIGDGFLFAQPFGDAPATLSASQIGTTDEVWTQWITYVDLSSVDDWNLMDY
ncbi:MAG: hypothetical protein SF028_13680 [Candidatus Sumerlaeia bacterium]|nr:hypothetical protein [Candidatus Sumerlaeia bacterium]